MKNAIWITGLLLVLAGLAGFFGKEVSYTKDTTAAKLGPLELKVQETETWRIPPWLSLGAIGVGAVLVVVGLRKR